MNNTPPLQSRDSNTESNMINGRASNEQERLKIISNRGTRKATTHADTPTRHQEEVDELIEFIKARTKRQKLRPGAEPVLSFFLFSVQ